jgi:hypothetical protein
LTSIYVPATRPTVDIDFLAQKIKNDDENICGIFKEVISIGCEDGIIFDVNSIKTETIKKEADYNGIRVKIRGNLGQATQILQADLGV